MSLLYSRELQNFPSFDILFQNMTNEKMEADGGQDPS